MLGSYELGEVLGRGTMGEVHRASRSGTDGDIAVKVLRPELASDPELIARFLQERKVLCSLAHPNLVRVHDLVVENGTAAIVMDLVDGSNLRTTLSEAGTLPAANAVELILQLLSALTVVHEAGIVHRDVKPENVLVAADGQIRLVDFGIARIAHGPSLTRMTGLIGTPEYLAPELAEREHATPAADVYSTGITLYEMLTGFTPFCGGHPVAVLRRHIEEDAARPDGIPDAFWSLLDSMLKKNPSARPTAAEAKHTLTTLAPSLADLPALPKTRPSRDEDAPTALRRRQPDLQEAATVLRGEKTDPGRIRTKRLPLLVAIGAVIAIVATISGVLVGIAGKGTSALAASSYAFKPQSYPSGLVVDRLWSINGAKRDQLQAKVVLTDGTANPFQVSYDEVIPKSVATSARVIAFTPTPDQVVQSDPVVRYDVHLASEASMSFSYTVHIGPTTGTTLARLKSLAASQMDAQARYLESTGQKAPATLSQLKTTPSSLTIQVGQTSVLTLSGVMSDGSAANPAELAGVVWSSSAPGVAVVAGGVVTGAAAGSAVVLVQAGTLSVTVPLTVVAAAGSPAGTASPGQTSSGLTTPPSYAPPTTSPRTPATSPPTTSTPRTSPPTTSPPTTPPPTTSPPTTVPPTWTEQSGYTGSPTFTDPYNASGQGPTIGAGAYVQVSCKVYAPQIQSANPDGYWYRIASSPWNNAYYAVANTFMNGDAWGCWNSHTCTHNTDFSVPNC